MTPAEKSTTTLTAAAVLAALTIPGRPAFTGCSRRNEDHLNLLQAAGATPGQAADILRELGGNPDRPWETTDVGYAAHHRATAESQAQAAERRRVLLAEATPVAYAQLLGLDGAQALVTSRPLVRVFQAMRASGWVLTAATGHGQYAFSSPSGVKSINVMMFNDVTIYDARYNRISEAKALAYVEAAS